MYRTLFDIGVTTRRALERYRRTGDPLAGSSDPSTAGNGSLMRLAPVALRYWGDRAILDRVASQQSRTTHAAPEAVDGCRAFAGLLADAISGMPRRDILAPRTFEGSRGIAQILAGSWRGRVRDGIRSSGYVVHTLEAAIWSVARTADFRNSVLLAANLADDADTVAAVTGQLAGSIYGLSGIPGGLAWPDCLEGSSPRHRAATARNAANGVIRITRLGTCGLTMPPRCRWAGVVVTLRHFQVPQLFGVVSTAGLARWLESRAKERSTPESPTLAAPPSIRWPASSTAKPPVPNISTGPISGGQSPSHCSWLAPKRTRRGAD